MLRGSCENTQIFRPCTFWHGQNHPFLMQATEELGTLIYRRKKLEQTRTYDSDLCSPVLDSATDKLANLVTARAEVCEFTNRSRIDRWGCGDEVIRRLYCIDRIISGYADVEERKSNPCFLWIFLHHLPERRALGKVLKEPFLRYKWLPTCGSFQFKFEVLQWILTTYGNRHISVYTGSSREGCLHLSAYLLLNQVQTLVTIAL